MLVSEQFIQVLDDLCKRFGIAIDWTNENIVPYITTLFEKFIRWEIATSIVWLVVWSLGFIICSVLVFKKGKQLIDELEDFGAVIFFFFVLIGMVCIVGVITQTIDIVTCMTFPEMQLIEYIQNAF